MARHAHTRPNRQQCGVKQCELREIGTRQTRRAVDSKTCAMKPGMEVVIWANSTRVNRIGPRIQELQCSQAFREALRVALPRRSCRNDRRPHGRRRAAVNDSPAWRARSVAAHWVRFAPTTWQPAGACRTFPCKADGRGFRQSKPVKLSARDRVACRGRAQLGRGARQVTASQRRCMTPIRRSIPGPAPPLQPGWGVQLMSTERALS